MKETLISFNTAVLAKEKGFNIPQPKCCIRQKDSGNLLTEMWSDSLNEFDVLLCYQPTQSLLQKWLREEHKIEVLPIPDSHDSKRIYNCTIMSNLYSTDILRTNNGEDLFMVFNTYEEALEEGLYQALNLIKT